MWAVVIFEELIEAMNLYGYSIRLITLFMVPLFYRWAIFMTLALIALYNVSFWDLMMFDIAAVHTPLTSQDCLSILLGTLLFTLPIPYSYTGNGSFVFNIFISRNHPLFFRHSWEHTIFVLQCRIVVS